MKTYTQFAEYLGKKTERPLANNTRVRLVEPGKIAIRLHGTDIIVLDELGNVTLNTGGWRTSTTKARINEYTPVCLWQNKGVWSFTWGAGNVSHVFADGVTLHADGTVTGDAPKSQQDEEKELRKQIKAYAAKAVAAFPLERPGAGDCFYCQMRDVATGKPLGESNNDTSHLCSHFDEGYIVPSLVYRAFQFANCGPLVISGAFKDGTNNHSDYLLGLARNYGRRAVRKYLYRQFGLA